MAHDSRHHHHTDHHGTGHHHDGDDSAVRAEMLDLDAQVLGGYHAQITRRVHDLTEGRPVRRIADLGCGTGNGALALAEAFGDAEVVAVDQSAEFLARLRDKASERGLASRVRTVEGNLDESWPDLGTVDLVWMSMALHHLADPDAGLRRIFSMLSHGGLLAVAEMSAHMRFLPEDVGVGSPGLEDRCQVALAELMADTLPDLGSDWGPRLAEAGFSEVTRQDFDLTPDPLLPAEFGRFSQLTLARMRFRLDGLLSAEDLAALDTITSSDGPLSVVHRQDLAIRGTRMLWSGRSE